MNNDDERDYAEEAYNLATMHDEAELDDDDQCCPRCRAISWGQTPDGRLECTRCLWVAA